MVHVLSCHATYRCQRRGVCCTSGWPIPVEADRLARMRAAMASGQLRASRVSGATPPFAIADDAADDPPTLLGVDHSRCVFFETDNPRRCLVHDALGHSALPLACRQFPRVSVHDPRGVSVVLSHYCPTAAALLDDEADVTIVSDAPAFPPNGEYVGLDATTSLPPLLRPGMLMDWEGWWDLERHAVEWLGAADGDPGTRLARLEAVVDDVEPWVPSDGRLSDRIATAFADAARRPTTSRMEDDDRRAQRARQVWAAIPDAWRPDQASLEPSAPPGSDVVCRFLATHAFANWAIHLGRGLRTWLASIDAAHGLIQSGLDIATTDLVLRHLADPRELAATWQDRQPVDM